MKYIFTCPVCTKAGTSTCSKQKCHKTCLDTYNAYMSRFGTLQVELKCIVCKHKSESIYDFTGHHVIPREVDPKGKRVVLCIKCHRAVHTLGFKPGMIIDDDGLQNLKMLTEKAFLRYETPWETGAEAIFYTEKEKREIFEKKGWCKPLNKEA